MSAFAKLPELGPLAIWTGALARAVQGTHITMAVVERRPPASFHSTLTRASSSGSW
jgi:hypothetical protein